MNVDGLTQDQVRERILGALSEATGSPDVLTQPDLLLYESGLLDSLGTVALMVAIEEQFGVTISPAEFDREAWSTPRKLVADLVRRLAANAQ